VLSPQKTDNRIRCYPDAIVGDPERKLKTNYFKVSEMAVVKRISSLECHCLPCIFINACESDSEFLLN
jgi:hypothetical protein